MNNSSELPDFNHTDTIVRPDRIWQFSACDLNDHRGITTKLDKQVWLDWHDVLAEPEVARMHMYPGESKNVGINIKRLRMHTWQTAIQVFDSMLVDVQAPLSGTQVIDLIKSQHLPRPQIIQLPTSNPSLVRLLESLGIRQIDGEHTVKWSDFVHFAREGAIVQPKRYLRKQAEIQGA